MITGLTQHVTRRQPFDEHGEPLPAFWAVELRWMKDGRSRADYVSVTDEPTDNDVATAVLMLKTRHGLE